MPNSQMAFTAHDREDLTTVKVQLTHMNSKLDEVLLVLKAIETRKADQAALEEAKRELADHEARIRAIEKVIPVVPTDQVFRLELDKRDKVIDDLRKFQWMAAGAAAGGGALLSFIIQKFAK